MEEDPLLTPKPWWGSRLYANYPRYHARRPSAAWAPGAALLGAIVVGVPILLFVVSKL